MISMTTTVIFLLAKLVDVSSQEEWRYTGDNVALTRPTGQWPGTYLAYEAYYAVDGSSDSLPTNRHCSVTTRVYNTDARWSVNLNNWYILKGIRIYNQYNDRESLGNFQVIGYPSGVVLHDDRTASRPLYNDLVINIPVYSTAAFYSVRVLSPAHTGWPNDGWSQLTLCVVEIYRDNVDGGWSDWSFYSSCSVTCGTGRITRTRTCTSPAPQSGGAYCSGDATEYIPCDRGNCPIDGGWTGWFPLTLCSVTCGSGWYTRTMTCTNPVPQYNGVGCSGEDEETTACNYGNCPIDGGWSDWSTWTACSVTCGSGWNTRNRTCTNPAPQNGGADCSGDDTEYIDCDHGNCPIDGGWTYWSTWTSCSVTCGTGETSRNRACTYPAPQYNGGNCPGNATDVLSCALGNCTSEASHLSSEGTPDKSSVAPLAAGAGVGGSVAIVAVVGIVFFVVYRRRRRRGDPYSVPDNTYENHVCYSDLQNELNEKEEKKEEKKVKAQKEEKKEEKKVKEQNEEKREEKNVKAQKEEKKEEQKDKEQKEEKNEEKKLKVQNEEKKEEKIVKEQKEKNKVKAQKEEKKQKKNEEKTVKEQKEDKKEEKRVKEQNEDKKEENMVKAQIEEKKEENIEEKKVKEQKEEKKKEKKEENMSVVFQDEVINEEKGDTYYSFAEKSELPDTAIKVDELPDEVFAGDVSSKRFTKEFRAFPEGMTKAHEKALLNRKKNRYKDIYAYDKTRVVLDIWDEGKDTDYINACYIHGFTKPKAYIASQGVTLENMDDFWRMVWQANSKKIVMLTKLYEEDKVKCLQYWPNEDPVTHGHITVSLESTEPFCNFIIRTLLVEKSGEPQRRVKHFHFTTWPDRDVPAFCSSFVHFRNKIKTATSPLDGPASCIADQLKSSSNNATQEGIYVCDAGIGMTGTFIAIDYLAEQGREMGYVDAVRCVETLRRQRVVMVQKEIQYVFIHHALVEILLLKTSVVSTAEFAESYQDMLEHENGKRKLDEEFELLQKLSPKKAKQKAETNVQYMPSLSGPGRTRDNEYINATFLPMYREDDALIITQTPLETTKEDFWKLVYHQQVHTVVMMDHIPQLEEHQVQVIQFSAWDDDEPLPDSPTHMLTALELVADNQRRFGNRPIVVHCMDGVERSGLFCVIAALLDRTKIEQDVAISQVIQEMRNRRGNVIPSVEQLQFCHEVVLEFMQQFQTYSNFSSSVRSRECSANETLLLS